MPVSKNGKFYWINKGETFGFRLAYIPDGMMQANRVLKSLGMPMWVHVSATPFSSGKKTQTCAGKDRCDLCYANHNPTQKFPTHVILVGPEHGKFDGKEVIFDMASSAHRIVLERMNDMLGNGATDEDLLGTVFNLTRLTDTSKPPYYTCEIVRTTSYVLEEEAPAELTDDDYAILQKIDAILSKREVVNPVGSVTKTLKEKYEWSKAKIRLAFTEALDEDGRLVDERRQR